MWKNRETLGTPPYPVQWPFPLLIPFLVSNPNPNLHLWRLHPGGVDQTLVILLGKMLTTQRFWGLSDYPLSSPLKQLDHHTWPLNHLIILKPFREGSHHVTPLITHRLGAARIWGETVAYIALIATYLSPSFIASRFVEVYLFVQAIVAMQIQGYWCCK